MEGFRHNLSKATEADIAKATDLFLCACEQNSFRKCAKVQAELIKHLQDCRPSPALAKMMEADIADYVGREYGWLPLLAVDAPTPTPTLARRRLREDA